MHLTNHKTVKSRLLTNANANGVAFNENATFFQAHHYRSDTGIARPKITEMPKTDMYKICLAAINFPIHYTGFPPVANCSTLLFLHPDVKQPEQFTEGKCYECIFATEYLSKKTSELSTIMNIFNPKTATAYLVNHTLEWRIEEIFESMIEESLVKRPYKNEMLQNLITEMAIFTQRLIPVELTS